MVQGGGAQHDSQSTWSIREKLLLAQAVHQVQSKASPEKPIDWTQVSALLEQFLKSKEEEIKGLDISFDDHTVCSDVYAKLCQTYLQDQNQQSLNDSQTFSITRQLYANYLRSISEALQEAEKRCHNIKLEIEEIARGEWDDRLKASNNQQLQTSSELSNSEPIGLDTKDPSHPSTLTSGSVPTSIPSGSTLRKSPNPETTKQVQEARSSEVPATRGRKRKATCLNTSDANKKVEKEESEKRIDRPERTDDQSIGEYLESIKTSTSRSRAPKLVESSSSDDDDDDAAVEQLVKASEPLSSTKTNLRSRQTRKIELEPSGPGDSKKDLSRSNVSLSKKARLRDQDDLSRDLQTKGKSPAPGHSSSHKEEEGTIVTQEKLEQGRRTTNSPLPNKSPTTHQSPADGNRGGGKMTDESHSRTHSPGSTKKSIIENEVSADGSHAGTPNSATFGVGTTEGNLTANQTPNSVKLTLHAAGTTETSSTQSGRVTGTTNDPTSFRRRMLKTHSSVQSNPISSIFRDPVKESEAPGYYSIIKRPMDLRTLAKKLRDGKVVSTEEYRRDLMLMLANAVMFNHEESEVTRHAKELMVECDRLVSIFMRGSRY